MVGASFLLRTRIRAVNDHITELRRAIHKSGHSPELGYIAVKLLAQGF